VGLFALGLAACGTPATGGAQAIPTTPALTPAGPTAAPTATSAVQDGADSEASVSGIGVVKPVQDANLTFAVQGTVDKVLVKEGDVVTQGQLLAILDVRTFDEQVEAALTEARRVADVRAAQAQVRQAQIALAQARTSQTQGVRSAQAGVNTAQSSL
jgi:multidrug efflux pump subunit AcrA (membrane-fusion protein)